MMLLITHRHNAVLFLVLAIFFALLGGYAYFESRAMLTGPTLTITTSKTPEPTADSTFTVHGTSKNVATLSVNGTPVALTTEGMFGTRVLLAPGYNTVVLTALDTLGRETSEVLSVVYTPPAHDDTSPAVGSLTINDDLL